MARLVPRARRPRGDGGRGSERCAQGLAEEQAQATSKESVLSEMGAAVSKFREQLGESLASVQRYDAKIEEASTRSLDALKA